MAEAVGLAASLISLASLFSTCIECFEYYKAAKECPEQITMKLVQLDFEKTRLLVWANHIGLVSTGLTHRDPAIELYEDDLRATLEQIYLLLSEASKMQDKYGMRKHDATPPLGSPSTDVLSRNSLDTFKAAYRRFRGKFLPVDAVSKLAVRFRWAITDETRFEGLIKTLKDFVDNLFWLVKVDRSILDHIVEEDIMAVTNLRDLEVIREASENEYQAWSEVASRVVDRTERGTILSTRSSDEEQIDEGVLEPESIIDHTDKQTVGEVYDPIEQWEGLDPPACFVVTETCQSSPTPCQDYNFGFEISPTAFRNKSYYASTSFASESLSFKLSTKFSLGIMTRRDIQERLAERRKGSLRAQWYATAFIYVAPCERLIGQALCICDGINKQAFFRCRVRVDDRLSVSCCQPGAEHTRLVSLLQRLNLPQTQDINLQNREDRGPSLLSLDKLWLEQRTFEVAEEEQQQRPSSDKAAKFRHCYQTESYTTWDIVAAIIQVGEEAQIREIMASESFPKHPHVPSATETFVMRGDGHGKFTRVYMGTYRLNPLLKHKDLKSNFSVANEASPAAPVSTSNSSYSSESPPELQKTSNGVSNADQEIRGSSDGSQALEPPAVELQATSPLMVDATL